MLPIISIVGRSESGKTTLLVTLITELKRRGYKVAIMKHSGDNVVELDTVNKDTWRFSQAGSELSAISSAQKLAIYKQVDPDFSPEQLSHFVSCDCDLILTEGFKQSSYPKIEVHRREQGEDLVSLTEQLLAVVTDEPLEIDVPQFTENDTTKISDIIENEILDHQKEDDIDLLINGIRIPINASFRALLTRTIIRVVTTLKDANELKNIRISLRRKP
ncbi:molybdopterin-guanine dinucleotide biosynthesis protein B [Chloroflexota bacterium]